eukprot:gene7675-8482_t
MEAKVMTSNEEGTVNGEGTANGQGTVNGEGTVNEEGTTNWKGTTNEEGQGLPFVETIVHRSDFEQKMDASTEGNKAVDLPVIEEIIPEELQPGNGKPSKLTAADRSLSRHSRCKNSTIAKLKKLASFSYKHILKMLSQAEIKAALNIFGYSVPHDVAGVDLAKQLAWHLKYEMLMQPQKSKDTIPSTASKHASVAADSNIPTVPSLSMHENNSMSSDENRESNECKGPSPLDPQQAEIAIMPNSRIKKATNSRFAGANELQEIYDRLQKSGYSPNSIYKNLKASEIHSLLHLYEHAQGRTWKQAGILKATAANHLSGLITTMGWQPLLQNLRLPLTSLDTPSHAQEQFFSSVVSFVPDGAPSHDHNLPESEPQSSSQANQPPKRLNVTQDIKEPAWVQVLQADISVLDQYSSQSYHQNLQKSAGENWKILTNHPDVLKILAKHESTALHQLLIDRLHRSDKCGKVRL